MVNNAIYGIFGENVHVCLVFARQNANDLCYAALSMSDIDCSVVEAGLTAHVQ